MKNDKYMSSSAHTAPKRSLEEHEQTTTHHLTAEPGGALSIEDFNILKALDKDIIANTSLAEFKSTNALYAIKSVQKQNLIANNETDIVHATKRAFLLANASRHPFLLHMHSCFQTTDQIIFVTEHCAGGNLLFHIQRRPFSAGQTRFYAAEICLALKYLHDQGVLHRNLKLDNILLTADGHIKLSDFYFCKSGMQHGSRTRTFCGTMEFMAPEVLLDNGKGYGFPVDWWAFGVVLYQMSTSQSPFQGEDEDEIYDAMLIQDPVYPEGLPVASVSILRGLLAGDPEQRLGAAEGDAAEVMAHEYFGGVDWEDVFHQKVELPFVPTVSEKGDVRNFDVQGIDVGDVLKSTDDVLTQEMQEQFRGFDYTTDMI